jgi:hypothetical protein
MVEIKTTTAAQSTPTIGDFLLRRLREAGISQLFGVAGDFNLEFPVSTETVTVPMVIGCGVSILNKPHNIRHSMVTAITVTNAIRLVRERPADQYDRLFIRAEPYRSLYVC